MKGITHDRYVIQDNGGPHEKRKPANPAELLCHRRQSLRRTALVFLPESVFNDDQRNAGRHQGHEIRNKERAAAVLESLVGKPPDIAQPDRAPHCSEDKSRAAGPSLPVVLRHNLFPRKLNEECVSKRWQKGRKRQIF